MDNSTIPCNLHQDSIKAMNEVKLKINHELSINSKAKYAEELSNKADRLAHCLQYIDQKLDCQYCRMIAALNRKTAELIIKARSLSL